MSALVFVFFFCFWIKCYINYYISKPRADKKKKNTMDINKEIQKKYGCEHKKTPEEAKILFKKAETFEDLKELMLCVLAGTMPSPVYHFEPVEEENSDNSWWELRAWKHLLEMNEQGFVTTESEDGENDDDVYVRASVTGLLHHSKVAHVVKKLNLGGFVAWAEPPYAMYKKSTDNFDRAIPRVLGPGDSTGAVLPFGAGAMSAMGAFESPLPEVYPYRFLKEDLLKTLKDDYVVLQVFDPSFARSGEDKLFPAVVEAVKAAPSAGASQKVKARTDFQDGKGLNTLTIPVEPDDDAYIRFRSAKSFGDLMVLMEKALSKIKQSPVQVVSSKTALQHIIDMTKLGFVTTEAEYDSQSNSATQSSRASLAGLLHKSRLAGVKKALNRAGLVAWAELVKTQEDRYRDEKTQEIVDREIHAGELFAKAADTALDEMDNNRTRDDRKIAQTWKESNIEGVRHNTIMRTYNIHIPGIISNEGVEASVPFGAGSKAAVHRLKDLGSFWLHKTLRDDYVVLTVFDPVFGRPAEEGLFPAVIETLKVL